MAENSPKRKRGRHKLHLILFLGQTFQQPFVMMLPCGPCDMDDIWLQSRSWSSKYKQWGAMATTVTANPKSPEWENDPIEISMVKQRTEPRFTVSFMSRQSSAFPSLLCLMHESLLCHYCSPLVWTLAQTKSRNNGTRA